VSGFRLGHGYGGQVSRTSYGACGFPLRQGYGGQVSRTCVM